jgi:hypothetical protein
MMKIEGSGSASGSQSGSISVALGFFYREPSATGSYCWLPAPLGWKLAYVGNRKTVENNRNWAELLLHDVYFICS